MLRPALALFFMLVALAASPSAVAHGEGGVPLGYRSTVTGVQPDVPGLTLEVLDADDRLLLTNESGKTVVVLGYEEEPYLRVTPDGVFQNVRSPATYLNEDRYAEAELPDEADTSAPPEWERISDEPRAEWHDHRIHWMSTVDPPVVQADPDSPHRILDWEVPLEVDGRSVVVAGRLDYSPPDESTFAPILLVPLVVLALVGGAFWWFRRRGERSEDAALGDHLGDRAARGRDGVR